MQALFVHGMGRTSLSGWPLLHKLRAAGISTHTFGYSTINGDFMQIAQKLSVQISKVAAQGEYILIGHSLGGLLLRAAMINCPSGMHSPVRIFLLGSPVKSVRMAKILRHNFIYKVLTRDCGQLLASDRRMDTIASVKVPTTGIIGVRGVRATVHVFKDEPNDGILAVAEASAHWFSEEIHVPVIHTLLPASNRVANLILERISQS